MRGILVTVEARLVRGNLEQHAARRAEVDRPEIVAIDHRGYLIAGIHQRFSDFELLFAVIDGKGDVMDGASTLTGKWRFRQGNQIDRIGAIAAGDDKASDITFRFGTLIAHEADQFFRRRRVMQIETCSGKTADRRVVGNTLRQPGLAVVIGRFDQCQRIAIRPHEPQPVGTEDGIGFKPADALCSKAVLPKLQPALGDRELGFADFADARAAKHHVLEGEIGHDRAGRTVFVTVIEVVDAGIVEIDGLLDPAQAERFGEEAVVLTGIRRHRRDVVQSLDILDHLSAFLSRRLSVFVDRDLGRLISSRNCNITFD
ncbi:hypothetical protein D3C73_888410 [compost metagenome]